MTLLFMLTASGLFGIGLYGFFVHDHLMRKLLAMNIMVSGVFLILITLARRDPAAIDPLPHAMVLTGIVIAVSTTALALTLLKRLQQNSPGSQR